jgi:hypothetical protein
MYAQRNIEELTRNHCYRGKAIGIKHYVILALVIRHANRKFSAPVACLTGSNIFFTLSHKRHNSR